MTDPAPTPAPWTTKGTTLLADIPEEESTKPFHIATFDHAADAELTARMRNEWPLLEALEAIAFKIKWGVPLPSAPYAELAAALDALDRHRQEAPCPMCGAEAGDCDGSCNREI